MTIVITHRGAVWKQTPTGFFKNGVAIATADLPLDVRYLFGVASCGFSDL